MGPDSDRLPVGMKEAAGTKPYCKAKPRSTGYICCRMLMHIHRSRHIIMCTHAYLHTVIYPVTHHIHTCIHTFP